MATQMTPPPAPADEVAVARPAPVSPAPALEYDNKPPQVTRRQMRYFLLLLTVNTLLFAAFICLPTASPFLKQMWEQYQAERYQAAEAAKQRALVDACMRYTAPADQVVYAEARADADKLLAKAGQAYLVDGSVRGGNGGLFGGGGARQGGLFDGHNKNDDEAALIASGWRAPASQGPVAPLLALAAADQNSPAAQSSCEGVVFLHQMTTPAGLKRLVLVAIDVDRVLAQRQTDGNERHYDFALTRRFSAFVFDQDALHPVLTSAVLQSPATDRMLLISKPEGKAELKNRAGHWRVFAGQPDPADPSHFTIAYEINGQPGVIDGRLKDGDRLMLEPRVGRLTGWKSGAEYLWDLSGAPPATRPAR